MKLLIIVLIFTGLMVGFALKYKNFLLERKTTPYNTLIDDFENKFGIFKRYNYQAYQEALDYLEAFYSMQAVASSYQLYSNAEDMYRGCLNALQSIVISVDDRPFLNVLQENISLLDAELQLVLLEYRDKLEPLEITTSWKVLASPDEPKAFKYPELAENDAYKWFI
jgi:hypothetical protein